MMSSKTQIDVGLAAHNAAGVAYVNSELPAILTREAERRGFDVEFRILARPETGQTRFGHVKFWFYPPFDDLYFRSVGSSERRTWDTAYEIVYDSLVGRFETELLDVALTAEGR